MKWPDPSRLERRADRLEELAAGLDAGLDVDAAFTAARLGSRTADGTVAERACAALPHLDPVDRAVLEAAETAGSVPRAVRDLAEHDRARAARIRDVGRRLAYPLFLCAFATAVVAWLAFLGFRTIPPAVAGAWVAVVVLAVGAVVWLLRRSRRDPSFDARRVPLLGQLADDAAAVPYLEAMQRLHAAGVRIDAAHDLATRACPLARPRAKLTAAATSLRAGRPLSESLEAADALDPDTRRLIENAERIGQLEDAFGKAATHRRALFDVRARRATRTIGVIAYVLAALLVLWVVTSFYGGLYDRLRFGPR